MEFAAISVLVKYSIYIAPALLFFALWFLLTPANATGLRLAILLAGFVLMRDAMTPLGIWTPSATMQIAFHQDPLVLAGLGLASLTIVLGLIKMLPDMAASLNSFSNGPATGTMVGFVAGAAVALPLLLLNGLNVDRFAQVPWMVGMVVFAYGGNALEEVLFRGFLQGYLETLISPWRAALTSGIAFAACHSFLAFTVTQIGWPILAFTLGQGIVCALVRMRYGLIPAILTHGTAILLISMPMGTT